ncbi:MAG: aromatic amino acid transport family protein [Nanoarchaeota archaeon]
MDKSVYEAVATLLGVMIGAGIFGIPYVFAHSGFLTGLLTLIIIAFSMTLINLYIGEVTLRTKGNHQLTGYASIYLGKTGKVLMTVSMVFGIYGALLAYIIGEGESLNAIFTFNPLFYSIVFFGVMSLFVYYGLKAIKESELVMGIIKLSIFLIIFITLFFSGKVNTGNLVGFNLANIFVPFGVVLFAFLATAAIPEMKEELAKKERYLKRALIIGGLIAFFAYMLFAFVIVGVTGQETTEVATVGLANLLGQKVHVLLNLFAVFAMATAFLGLGLALKEMYIYDYKLNKNLAWFLTCFVPLALFLFGIKSFTRTIAVTGAVSGGIVGVLAIMMAYRAKAVGERKPEYSIPVNGFLSFILVIVFLLAIVYSII